MCCRYWYSETAVKAGHATATVDQAHWQGGLFLVVTPKFVTIYEYKFLIYTDYESVHSPTKVMHYLSIL